MGKDERLTTELKSLNNSVPGGVARMRYEDGLIVEYANDGLYRLMHTTREEVSKAGDIHYESLLREEDWKLLQEKIENSLKTGEMIRMEYPVINGEKLQEWRMMHALVLRQEEKIILQCTIMDISDHKSTEHMLDSLLQNMAVGIMRAFFDGESAELIFVSDSARRMFGYSLEEHEKQRKATKGFFVFREYEDKLIEDAKAAMEGIAIPPAEYRLARKDGSKIWIVLRAEVVSRTQKGILIQYVLVDNTQAHDSYEQVRIEKEKLQIIAEIAADMLFEYDVQTDSMHYITQREDGLSADPVEDNYLQWIQQAGMVHPDDREELLDFVDQMRGGKMDVHTEIRKRFSDRKYHWIEVDGRTFYDMDGNALKIVGKITNIDERKEQEERLKLGSERDSLTGLYNHMTCIELIKKQLDTMKTGDRCILMICDVDNFKKINDKNGHLFGDAVLCTFADELRNLFPSAIKGRIGGDEFLVLVKNMDQAVVESKLYQLNSQFSKLNADDIDREKISCSIGAVVCTSEEHSYEKAFQFADHALYKVKNGEKGVFMMTQIEDTGDEDYQSYLETKEEIEDYIRAESLIQNDEELVRFTLELLDNVTDIRSGLKMVSDRICRYFGFDDIILLKCKDEIYEKVYHWGPMGQSPFTNMPVFESAYGWQYVEGKYDEQGVAVLERSEMENLPGRTMGSLLFVRYMQEDGSKSLVIFMDRLSQRNWTDERITLQRIASIIFNRVEQLRSEEQERAEMERRVNYDSVTGLPNYSKFLSLCEQYLQELKPDKENPYYFAYADFANFQYLNEVYGYSAGDTVLKHFGEWLNNSEKGIYFTRITSDHFIGMFKCEEGEDVIKRVQGYLTEFCQSMKPEYPLCNLNIICGLSICDDPSMTISAMVDYANVARKFAKNKVETCCILYDDEIRQRSENEMNIVANMTTAIENHEFQVYLQPKVDLHTGKSSGAEALVRWRKPDGSMIYPDQFIPVFERNGFITKVDFYVLEEVLKYLQDAISNNEAVVPVSVNFSRMHNEDEMFVEKIGTLLEQYQIDPSLLEAEVTESVYMQDLNILKEKIMRLQEMGVTISIDDFGSGYSSLNMLSQVAADVIKLDRQFLMEDQGGMSPEFMKHLIDMLKHLGYQIIAEGVETKEQMEMLKGADCDMVQGYYYARPMPIPDFRKFLREFNGKLKEQ